MEFSSQRIEMFLIWPPPRLPWHHLQTSNCLTRRVSSVVATCKTVQIILFFPCIFNQWMRVLVACVKVKQEGISQTCPLVDHFALQISISLLETAYLPLFLPNLVA